MMIVRKNKCKNNIINSISKRKNISQVVKYIRAQVKIIDSKSKIYNDSIFSNLLDLIELLDYFL